MFVEVGTHWLTYGKNAYWSPAARLVWRLLRSMLLPVMAWSRDIKNVRARGETRTRTTWSQVWCARPSRLAYELSFVLLIVRYGSVLMYWLYVARLVCRARRRKELKVVHVSVSVTASGYKSVLLRSCVTRDYSRCLEMESSNELKKSTQHLSSSFMHFCIAGTSKVTFSMLFNISGGH